MASAVIADDQMVIEAQMKVLQAFFSKDFERIYSKGEEDEYDSFPKFAYFGGGVSNGKDTIEVCVFFIFDDSVLIEGVQIYFIDCKIEEVNSVIDNIYQKASYAIDFSISIDFQDQWKVINPDYTASKYPGC